MNKSFKGLFSEAKKRNSYWVESAILEFTSELHLLMQAKGTTKSELAEILGTSPAYITKVFSGNANFTVETMVKLTRALDGQLRIHVAGKERAVRWFDIIDGGKKNEESDDWAQLTPQKQYTHKRIMVHG